MNSNGDDIAITGCFGTGSQTDSGISADQDDDSQMLLEKSFSEEMPEAFPRNSALNNSSNTDTHTEFKYMNVEQISISSNPSDAPSGYVNVNRQSGPVRYNHPAGNLTDAPPVRNVKDDIYDTPPKLNASEIQYADSKHPSDFIDQDFSTSDIYDVPPSTGSLTEDIYDTPPSTPRERDDVYDVPPTTGLPAEELYDTPPVSVDNCPGSVKHDYVNVNKRLLWHGQYQADPNTNVFLGNAPERPPKIKQNNCNLSIVQEGDIYDVPPHMASTDFEHQESLYDKDDYDYPPPALLQTHINKEHNDSNNNTHTIASQEYSYEDDDKDIYDTPPVTPVTTHNLSQISQSYQTENLDGDYVTLSTNPLRGNNISPSIHNCDGKPQLQPKPVTGNICMCLEIVPKIRINSYGNN